METMEQAQQAALELSKGYAGCMRGNTLSGLGWTVSLDESRGTFTATYETEDGELVSWSVDPKDSYDNQVNLEALILDVLRNAGLWGFEGWQEWGA